MKKELFKYRCPIKLSKQKFNFFRNTPYPPIFAKLWPNLLVVETSF
jgi:hypothetical protein